MKKLNISAISMRSIVILSLFFMSQCTNNDSKIYREIRDYSDQVKIINTHEHQHRPEEYGDYKFRFYHLVMASYLSADLVSAGMSQYGWKTIDSLSLDNLWNIYGEALNYARGSSYYSHFVKGFQKLYGFSDLYFTRENIAVLSASIEENYKNYGLWFNKAFHSAGYELMFLDQYWNQLNTEIDTNYFALVFNINSLITASSHKRDKGTESGIIYKEAASEGYEINNLDDYLKYCDHLINKNIEHNAVCLKNSQAYERTLLYEDVPYDEARILFDKPSSQLTTTEVKKIEDFVFHWIIKKAIEYDLPIQIHTGYLAGNGNVLDNGQPIKLNNLFLKYRKAKFILFHGGFPWTSEISALGKMFPNVFIDIVWLPQISREEAINELDVMFDCVPYNKFFWGGDCGLIEESTGSLEYGKDVVSEVLAKRVKRGLLTEDVAFEIVNRLFRENAIEIFNLTERLGREFY